jgi:hypothetical protein
MLFMFDVGRPRGTFSQVPVTEEEEHELPFSDEPPAGTVVFVR